MTEPVGDFPFLRVSIFEKLWLLVTYPYRRRYNMRDDCGCGFYAIPFGWKGVKCLDHWLD